MVKSQNIDVYLHFFVNIPLKNIFDSVGFTFAFIPCKRTRQTSKYFFWKNRRTPTLKLQRNWASASETVTTPDFYTTQ